MKKRFILSVIPMLVLCACSKDNSTSKPKVPTVTWSDTGSTDTNSGTDSNTSPIDAPDVTGATELSYEDAILLANKISEYQNSDSFSLPNDVVNIMNVEGTMTGAGIATIGNISSVTKGVYSASNHIFKNETSTGTEVYKMWDYIGNNPTDSADAGSYRIQAVVQGQEKGKYTQKAVENDALEDEFELIEKEYEETYFDVLTGNSVLSQLKGDDSGEIEVNCKYYSKGDGSLIVYGTIAINDYSTEIEGETYTGTMVSTVAYTWDNYLIKSGQTNVVFTVNMSIFEVEGDITTTQTVTLATTNKDRSLPLFDNMDLVESLFEEE